MLEWFKRPAPTWCIWGGSILSVLALIGPLALSVFLSWVYGWEFMPADKMGALTATFSGAGLVGLAGCMWVFNQIIYR